KDTSQSKQNLQSSSMTFIHKTLIIPSVLDSCFISSTVSEVKGYSAYVRRIVVDFSHAPLNEYSPSPDEKKQWSLVWFNFYKIPLCTNFAKKESMKKDFQDMLHGFGGEVNPVHAYYIGSCTSKDNEDSSGSTSFKTRRTKKTSSALEVLWKTLFLLYLYMIGTLSEFGQEVMRFWSIMGIIGYLLKCSSAVKDSLTILLSLLALSQLVA
ncbi:hypothetical protein Tco_0352165, partial [Tanacetum coccineum]